jgi:hypothetical protein
VEKSGRHRQRHDYEEVIPDALWKLASDGLPVLAAACRAELERMGSGIA